MEIKIKLDKDDWIQFQSYIEKSVKQQTKIHSNGFSFKTFAVSFFAGLIFMFFQPFGYLHTPTLLFSFVILLSLLVYLIIFNRICVAKIRNAHVPSETGIFVGEHDYFFDSDGIKCEGRSYKNQLSWDVVQKIVRADGMILIFIDTVQAFVFPESKLDDPDGFYDGINRYYSEATTN